MAGEEADGFILQLADPYLTEWMVKAVRRPPSPPDATRPTSRSAWPRPPTSRGRWSLAHARDQCRWFGGMVGNHVADLVSRYGEHSALVPEELTDYIKAARGLRLLATTGAPATRTPTSSPTRSSTGSACSARPRRTSRSCTRLRELGVDQFAVYDMHDAKEATIDAYGSKVIPAVNA